MTEGCEKQDARFNSRSTSAIRDRLPFMSTSSWACAFSRPLGWRHSIVRRTSVPAPCRFAFKRSLGSSVPARRPAKEQKQFKAAVKVKNLSRSFDQMGKQLREELDLAGRRDQILA